MTETVTESFCERCGTRYSFASAPKPKTLGRLRTLSRGLKSYVLSDASSLGDALTQAREDDKIRDSTSQLDQFHDTFSFCMSCRQYTCPSCWNTEANRCLSCAPLEGTTLAPIEVERPWIVSDPEAESVELDAPELWSESAELEELEGPEAAATASAADVADSLEPEPDGPTPTDEDAVDLAARLQFADRPAVDVTSRPDFQARSAWARRLAEASGPVPSDPEEFQKLLAQVEEEIDAFERGDEVSDGAAGGQVAEAMSLGASGNGAAEGVLGEADALPGPTGIQVDGTDAGGLMPMDASTEAETAASQSVAERGADDAPIGIAAAQAGLEAANAGDATDGVATVPAGLDVANADEAPDGVGPALPGLEVANAGEATDGIGAEEGAPALAADSAVEPMATAESATETDAPIGITVEGDARTPELPADAAGSTSATPTTPVDAAIGSTAEAAPPAAAAGEAVEPSELQAAAEATEPLPEAPPVWWIVAPDAANPGVDRGVQPTWPGADVRPGTPPPLPTVPTVKLPSGQTPRRMPPPPSSSAVWPAAPMNAAPAPQAHGNGKRPAASDALWAASSRQVAGKAGTSVQTCKQCGLSLSAAARFCRRCGSPQH